MNIKHKLPLSTILVGFAGKSGSGKSSIANALLPLLSDHLHNKAFIMKCGFATGLRREIYMAVQQWVLDLHPHAQVTFPLLSDLEQKPTPPYIRALLQWWGTDYRRHEDPDYWIKVFHRWALSMSTKPAIILVDDVRFPNEAAYIKDHGLLFWVSNLNPTAKLPSNQAHHASEKALGPHDATYKVTVIPARETPKQTATRILTFITHYLKKTPLASYVTSYTPEQLLLPLKLAICL